MHACTPTHLCVLEHLGRVPLVAAEIEQVGAHLQVTARQAAGVQAVS